MSNSDPFGFDMSVSSAKKKNPRGKRGLTGGSETSIQACQHEGCREPGKFRAP
ncbi:MAG: molecular chaperone DnaJ, partial [Paracoccaceae bacterium]